MLSFFVLLTSESCPKFRGAMANKSIAEFKRACKGMEGQKEVEREFVSRIQEIGAWLFKFVKAAELCAALKAILNGCAVHGPCRKEKLVRR